MNVLMSIRPKWVELILSGKKTIEVRKTRPKIAPPFTVYIYCTQDKSPVWLYDNEHGNVLKDGFRYSEFLTGKVIGEFVCKQIKQYACDFTGRYWTLDTHGYFTQEYPLYKKTCLSNSDLLVYGEEELLYGWHISDLKIYDKPRELKDFGLERAPQSWCYVELITEYRTPDTECKDCPAAQWCAQYQDWLKERETDDAEKCKQV